MASSGLASAAFSPICSTLIQSFGWRPAVFYMGIVSFLAALPFAAGMIYTPAAAGTSPVSSNDDKTPLKHSRNHCLLALCAFSLSAGAVLVQFANYIPVYAASIGFSATAGAVMTSCVMVGNILGKFLQVCLMTGSEPGTPYACILGLSLSPWFPFYPRPIMCFCCIWPPVYLGLFLGFPLSCHLSQPKKPLGSKAISHTSAIWYPSAMPSEQYLPSQLGISTTLPDRSPSFHIWYYLMSVLNVQCLNCWSLHQTRLGFPQILIQKRIQRAPIYFTAPAIPFCLVKVLSSSFPW